MSLRNLLKDGNFVTTVELDPPKSSSAKRALMQTAALKGHVDAINIADSPMSNMRMSSISLACLIQWQYGIETIFHLTCRDRNIIGLQSELLGAAALGVKNILTLTGDSPERGDHPHAKGVFEVDSRGLLKLSATLNAGVDSMGNKLEEPTNFYIGTTANPGADDLELEIKKLAQKIELGANFVQTQPIYDIAKAERFIQATRDLNIPIILGLIPLKSHKMAVYLHDKVPGISIPSEIIARMERGGRAEGIAIARETLVAIKNIAHGVHIMPLNDIDLVLQVLK